MAKKTEEVGVDEWAGIVDSTIVPIAHDYLREDLNELRDKLNQVIAVVNNL